MTLKQKRIIAILAIANLAVILAFAVVTTRLNTNTSPLPTTTLWAGASTPSPQSEDLADPSRTARLDEGSTRTPLPQSEAFVSKVPLPGACQWEAAQLLAQAGLGGTVVLLPDGLLCFEIVYPLPPGETADEAAQLVWIVFDVALALQERADECNSFTQVEATILAQSSQTDTQISASVSAADLAAFGAGELSEDEFIERVAYSIIRKAF